MIFAIYLLCFFYVGGDAGVNREYWIMIQERRWNYAPTGLNIISGEPIDEDAQASLYLKQGPDRIGATYLKALYIEYTNGSFLEEKKKPEWQGILGPCIRAEIGDIIIVHLFNNASRMYGFHPHGVRYTKSNEGALYPDNTSGSDKDDDHVPPGKTQTYTWEVVEDQGPTEWDDDCIIRLYHSHLDSPKDIYSGLIGYLILCKTGVLGKKRPVEYVLLLSVIDEMLSWYIDDNINTYCSDPESVDKEDEGFKQSNLKHAINGYMFGNLPGLSVCDNTDVVWYIASVGNEIDVHSIYFYGHVLTYQHRSVDTIMLLPASMFQASMVTQNPGKWLITSQVTDHLEAGMQAIYEVRNCSKMGPRQQPTVKRYYIAATEIVWNYGPTSINQFTGQRLDAPGSDSATYFEKNDNKIGGAYIKAVFKGYTSPDFTKEIPRSKQEKHLGILGPIIRVFGGDAVEIVFMNNASRPYSIQAHGLSLGKDMEGASYKTGDTGTVFTSTDQNGQSRPSHVAPGDIVTYKWNVPDSVAPTSKDPKCIAWLYYSSVDPIKDPYSGLIGPLIMCNKMTGAIDVNLLKLLQTGADYDFVMMPAIFDENRSWYLEDNIKRFTSNPESVDRNDPDFIESNKMHSINGYMYGNQDGLDLCLGVTARWHFLGIGSVSDIHGIHFTGNTIQILDNTKDVVSLTPHNSYSAVMKPDNVGVFNVECMTANHYKGGMRQKYRVNTCGIYSSVATSASRTVTYYIAIEEIEWNYSPNRTWEYIMYPDSSNRPGDVFLNQTNTTIGSAYIKAVYRGYTDQTFTKRLRTTEDETHLGILGPMIFCKVGDKVKVILKNKAYRTYSIYAHGLKPESDKTKPTEPGNTEVYVWDVPERSGPNTDEEDCLTWPYYSDVDRVKDIYSGLIGTIVVCNRSYNPLKGPDVRLALLFLVFDENKSWYLDENIQKYCLNPSQVDKNGNDFIESNKMHSINGLMYANTKLTMRVGNYVAWHIMGMGNEVDIHTAHWHGHSMEYSRGRVLHSDVFELLPGMSLTATMRARSAGTWLMHCHVDDHLYAGMVTVYTVLES